MAMGVVNMKFSEYGPLHGLTGFYDLIAKINKRLVNPTKYTPLLKNGLLKDRSP